MTKNIKDTIDTALGLKEAIKELRFLTDDLQTEIMNFAKVDSEWLYIVRRGDDYEYKLHLAMKGLVAATVATSSIHAKAVRELHNSQAESETDYLLRNEVDIIYNAVRCKHCGDTIESKHRHDYVKCSCGRCVVDGGLDYLRRTGDKDNFIELSIVN